MAESGVRMQAVLEGYAKFLKEKDLALPKHQPYLVGWVREFLLFAQGHGGYTFEQTLDMFLAEIGKRGGIEPWQIRQAADAQATFRSLARSDEPFQRRVAMVLLRWQMLKYPQYERSSGLLAPKVNALRMSIACRPPSLLAPAGIRLTLHSSASMIFLYIQRFLK